MSDLQPPLSIYGSTIRVVDREGGVWWTRPEHRDFFANLAQTHMNLDLPGDDQYSLFYWRKNKT